MLSMTNAYKSAMKKQFRDQSYMLVTIGIINQEAQKGSTFTETHGAEYLYLSNLVMLLDDYNVNNLYATLEQDYWKADGSMLFPPRENAVDYLWNQGAISKETLGPICISFNVAYDIRGLTVDWGENYPVDFSISNGTKTVEFTDNDLSYWTTEEIFDSTTYLLITPTKMVNGQDRLRIQKIYMGVGISFENKKIIKSTKDEYVSPISEQLPTMDFSLSIDNTGRVWDVENSESAINYLEIGQEVVTRYGMTLEDGSIVWMDGCTTILSDWEADDLVMSFTAKDKLEGLKDTFYGGRYRPEGITLYDLAVEVFDDAGIDDRYYRLDEYLKDYVVYNPLPASSQKECLQIIANAGRCKLYTDRDGTIVIEANIATVMETSRMTITSDTAAPWSFLDSVIDESYLQYDYATFSKDYWTADGQMLFLPKDSSQAFITGFVSDATANSEGYFDNYDAPLITADGDEILTNEGLPILFTQPAPVENPNFTIKLEASMTYFSLNLNFMANPPQIVVIRTYYEGDLVEEYEWDGPFELENTLSHEFARFDTINFEFVQAQPYSRVYVRSVVFGEITDYTFDYKVMTKTPKGKQETKVSNVNVTRTLYDYTDDVKTIFQQTIDFTYYPEYTFYFSSASYDIEVTADETTVLTILDSSDWFVTVDTSKLTGEHSVAVVGKAYVVTEKILTRAVNTTGEEEDWTNPLISTEEMANLQAEWLGNYFKNNIEYEISYRGEPRLDATDICFLENKYVYGLQIQLYEHQLNFSGAISGTVKARRAIKETIESGAGLMTADKHYILTADGQHIIPVT